MKHKDVVVEAVTGSGKTLAFVIPIFEFLLKRATPLKKHEIGALIISPTRELAQQIYDVVIRFHKNIPQFTSILFTGGTNPIDDLKNFASSGGHIVVCTAGRFEDLLERKTEQISIKSSLKSLEILILDEADRLLDLGFRKSLDSIMANLPKQRRTGLFSATQTDEIEKLIKAGLRNPCQIQVKQKGDAAKQKTPVNLNNYFIEVQPEKKFYELIMFLRQHKNEKHLIFMSTCACVQYFSRLLGNFVKNVEIFGLHRKLKDKRNKIFNNFKQLDKGILICTDLLSRGIDMDDVDWVIQYDPPNKAAAFVHRCGRTARSDRQGNAIVFLLPNEDTYVNFIKINQKVPLNEYKTNYIEDKQFTVETVTNKIQTLASKERELYEKGKEAFVSYIQAYSKHECSQILSLKELDLAKVALSFGLLHLPKMPELKNKQLEYKNFDCNYDAIPYKDKSKEASRAKELKTKKITRPKYSIPWSDKKEKKLKRKIKREKREIADKKTKRKAIDDNELNELQEDFKLLKKFKKRKISENEFNKNFINE